MPERLLAATQALIEKVDELAAHVDVSQRQVRRTRLLTWLALVLTVVCVAGTATTGVLIEQVHKANEANAHTQVITCRNANDQREQSLKLWTFVLSQSKAETHREAVAIKRLQAWIAELYAPRDCADLDKPYHIPPPPDLGLNGGKSS